MQEEKKAAANSGNKHDILNKVFMQSTLMHDLNDLSLNEVCAANCLAITLNVFSLK
jgi:hypothetical protein